MYRLCLKAGILDVESVKNNMTAEQFYNWQLFSRHEPFGATWENWLTAQVANITANGLLKNPPKFESYFYENEHFKRERKEREMFDFFERKVKH